MSLSLFICIEQILQWMLELLAWPGIPCIALLCLCWVFLCFQLPACLPSWHYPCVSDIDEFFLSILNTSSISSGCITPLSSLQYQSLLGALSLLSKNPDIIHLCVLYNIKSFYKTKMNIQPIIQVNSLWIPCGFLVDSDCSNFFIHLLIDCEVFFHLCNPLSASTFPGSHTLCYHCQKSSQHTSLKHFQILSWWPHPHTQYHCLHLCCWIYHMAHKPVLCCFSWLLETPHLHVHVHDLAFPPFRCVVITSSHCITKFDMRVALVVCYDSHGLQCAEVSQEASVIESSWNEMVVLDHWNFLILYRCMWMQFLWNLCVVDSIYRFVIIFL